MKINAVRLGAGTNRSILVAPYVVGGIYQSWQLEEVKPASSRFSCESVPCLAPEHTRDLPSNFHSPRSAVRGGQGFSLGCSVCKVNTDHSYFTNGRGETKRGCQTSTANQKRMSESSHDAVLLLQMAVWDYLSAKFKGEHQRKRTFAVIFYLKD